MPPATARQPALATRTGEAQKLETEQGVAVGLGGRAADRVGELTPDLEVTMHRLRGRAEQLLVEVSGRVDLLVLAALPARTARLGRVLTSRWQAELMAVMATGGGHDVLPTATMLEQAHEAGRRYLAEALAGRRDRWPDVRVTELLTLADPVTALERADQDARLLVVGSHGRRALERVVLGSVSASLLRTSPCPVAVVRPHGTAPHQREEHTHPDAALTGPLY